MMGLKAFVNDERDNCVFLQMRQAQCYGSWTCEFRSDNSSEVVYINRQFPDERLTTCPLLFEHAVRHFSKTPPSLSVLRTPSVKALFGWWDTGRCLYSGWSMALISVVLSEAVPLPIEEAHLPVLCTCIACRKDVVRSFKELLPDWRPLRPRRVDSYSEGALARLSDQASTSSGDLSSSAIISAQHSNCDVTEEYVSTQASTISELEELSGDGFDVYECANMLYVNDEDEAKAKAKAAALRRTEAAHERGHKVSVASRYNDLLKFLRALFAKQEASRSWNVARPGSEAYDQLCRRRRVPRLLGCIAPSICRDYTWHSYPEWEPYWLNELARRGTLYTIVQEAWVQAYPKDAACFDLLVNLWISLLELHAEGTEYESFDALLDDMKLARRASTEALQLTLSILKRDWHQYSNEGLLSERFHVSVIRSGHQAHEGGKANDDDGDSAEGNIEVTNEINGPTHFAFDDTTGSFYNKDEELAEHRKNHQGSDPKRRPIGRRFRASKSDALRAWEQVRKRSNVASGIVICLLDGMEHVMSLPEVFAIEEQYQGNICTDPRPIAIPFASHLTPRTSHLAPYATWIALPLVDGFSRVLGMTCEGASTGQGELPLQWTAPPTFPSWVDSYVIRSLPLKAFAADIQDVDLLCLSGSFFPRFPTDDNLNAEVTALCPPFPNEAVVAQLKDNATEYYAVLLSQLDDMMAEEEPPWVFANERERQHAEINLALAATASHVDVNCFGSGTEGCAPAFVTNLGVASESVHLLDGGFAEEGLPSILDKEGRRIVDEVCANDPTERGVTSSIQLTTKWEDERIFFAKFHQGRLRSVPGNKFHIGFGTGKATTADKVKTVLRNPRVRTADYTTTSFGGFAMRAAQRVPRLKLPLATLLAKEGAEALNEAEQHWSNRARLLDCEDEVRLRVLVHLLRPFVVERQSEEVEMHYEKRLVLSSKRLAQLEPCKVRGGCETASEAETFTEEHVELINQLLDRLMFASTDPALEEIVLNAATLRPLVIGWSGVYPLRLQPPIVATPHLPISPPCDCTSVPHSHPVCLSLQILSVVPRGMVHSLVSLDCWELATRRG